MTSHAPIAKEFNVIYPFFFKRFKIAATVQKPYGLIH